MNPKPKFWCMRFAIMGAYLLLSACQPKMTTMNPEEAQRIATLTERMTPRCVGRYLIDLPTEFILNTSGITKIEGVSFKASPMSKAQFDMRLQRRRLELTNQRIDGETTPSLTDVRELPDGAGLVFNRSETGADAFARTWELLTWSAGVMLEMTVNARDMALMRQFGPDDKRETNVEEKFTHLLKLHKRTSTRKDEDIPTLQGVCFANGFVEGPPTDEEWIDVYYHWQGKQDVYASFSSNSGIGPMGTTLPERAAAIEKALVSENGATLRHGRRKVNGLEFDEWLSRRQPDEGDAIIYNVTAEMNSKGGNALQPLLVFGLISGDEHPGPALTLEQAATAKPILKATLNAAETVALWDSISATLRLRPGAF